MGGARKLGGSCAPVASVVAAPAAMRAEAAHAVQAAHAAEAAERRHGVQALAALQPAPARHCTGAVQSISARTHTPQSNQVPLRRIDYCPASRDDELEAKTVARRMTSTLHYWRDFVAVRISALGIWPASKYRFKSHGINQIKRHERSLSREEVKAHPHALRGRHPLEASPGWTESKEARFTKKGN